MPFSTFYTIWSLYLSAVFHNKSKVKKREKHSRAICYLCIHAPHLLSIPSSRLLRSSSPSWPAQPHLLQLFLLSAQPHLLLLFVLSLSSLSSKGLVLASYCILIKLFQSIACKPRSKRIDRSVDNHGLICVGYFHLCRNWYQAQIQNFTSSDPALCLCPPSTEARPRLPICYYKN